MSTLRYWLWLTNLRSLSPPAAFRLLDYFGTPEAAYFADPAEYELVEDLGSAVKSALRDKSMDRAEEILSRCSELGVHILTLQDAQYPERLRQLSDPPAVLYVKGKLFPFDEEAAVGVVGARKATPYGVKTADELGRELARQGALVVSGIARGIDSAALRGALRAGGAVVSVLGNGVDVPYPQENEELYADVAAAGALVSEYPPGTQPNGRYFPIRNRIISGLSLGIIVVEGTETSGSLITARLALDQNRDVFAIPGNIDAPESRGPNLLIARGEASLITGAWDVLRDYAPRFPHKIRRNDKAALQAYRGETEAAEETESGRNSKKMVDIVPNRTYIDLQDDGKLTDDERDILLALEERALVADDLVGATGIPARRVLSALTMLQVQGYVTEEPGKQFRALARIKAK